MIGQGRWPSLRERLSRLRDYLNDSNPDPDTDLRDWFRHLASIRAIQANFSNDLSFIACLLAKQYLGEKFGVEAFDVALTSQGVPGLDIDIWTWNGERIVGEIKTTVPYSKAKQNLGAKQQEAFQADFAKLNNAKAEHKFLFVTHPLIYEVLLKRYAIKIPNVQIILLLPNEGNPYYPCCIHVHTNANHDLAAQIGKTSIQAIIPIGLQNSSWVLSPCYTAILTERTNNGFSATGGHQRDHTNSASRDWIFSPDALDRVLSRPLANQT